MIYSLFGCRLESDFPFSHHLGRGKGKPDLNFECVPGSFAGADLDAAETIYEASQPTPGGLSKAVLLRLDGGDVLRFHGLADFFLKTDRITCYLSNPEDGSLAETLLLGPVISYWLEGQGLPVLHASAVAAAGAAIGFLAGKGAGKSSLATAMMNMDWQLVTDDLLAIRGQRDVIEGLPGYPQMRFWRHQASALWGDLEQWRQVLPQRAGKLRVPVGDGGVGRFCSGAQPMRCLFLPRRRESDGDLSIHFERLLPRQSLIELVRGSFLPRLVEAAGLQAHRFGVLASLARTVPLVRLDFPSGVEHLPLVQDAIVAYLRDLGSTGTPAP